MEDGQIRKNVFWKEGPTVRRSSKHRWFLVVLSWKGADRDIDRQNHHLAVLRNVKEVRGFLGTVGPAGNWIRNYAVVARLLVRVAAGKIQDPDEVWTKEADEAFKRVKDNVSGRAWMRPVDYRSSEEV